MQPDAKPLRVLVVDDNHDLAWSVAVLLRAQGHDARAADDGRAALEVAAEFQPDVVLLDLTLPFMDGFEVARRLRETPSARAARYVAMTGYDRPEDRRRTAEAGFHSHLVKPIDVESLAAALRPPGA